MHYSRLAGSEEEEEEGEWKLYFKLYCFLDVESMPKEGVEFAFMFEQVSLHSCTKPSGGKRESVINCPLFYILFYVLFATLKKRTVGQRK